MTDPFKDTVFIVTITLSCDGGKVQYSAPHDPEYSVNPTDGTVRTPKNPGTVRFQLDGEHHKFESFELQERHPRLKKAEIMGPSAEITIPLYELVAATGRKEETCFYYGFTPGCPMGTCKSVDPKIVIPPDSGPEPEGGNPCGKSAAG